MRLRTIAKLGVILSVVLFCTAVGFYGFVKLDMTDKSKDVNLFSLVPAQDCVGVLESDNISHFLTGFSQQSYGEEWARFRFPGLFDILLGGLNEYATSTAHGLSGRMSRMLVSFHAPGSPRDQIVYFRMADSDEGALNAMLQRALAKEFSPKKEKYKGKSITVYPLADGDFLAAYGESGFFAVSYQKRLIEEVIDACEDHEKALVNDHVFAKVMEKKKSHSFLTLYARMASLPFLENAPVCWSEFDFHINSDVAYLTGDMFMPDTCTCVEQLSAKLRTVPDLHEDSLVLSADKAVIADYMSEAHQRMPDRTLFDECVANLSHEALFMLVTDMNKVAQEPERFTPYVPRFLLENAPLFQSFILSTQLSVVDDRISHIMVLTYKD